MVELTRAILLTEVWRLIGKAVEIADEEWEKAKGDVERKLEVLKIVDRIREIAKKKEVGKWPKSRAARVTRSQSGRWPTVERKGKNIIVG